jgi:tetratricopeptide (TPR) repeat protein
MALMSRRIIIVAALAVAVASVSFLPGQANRGGELGRVDFPTSTGSARAQEAFVRGVLLLHSFEYGDAAAEFQEAEKVDPNFAMAYWGEAMTENHPVWNERNEKAGRKALARLDPSSAGREAKATTLREKGFLRAVDVLYADGEKRERDRAYADEMATLHAEFPKDDEIALFYALALLGTCEGEREVPVYEKAGAIASEVFARRPDHPGAAHYVIHSFDDPMHAERALPAARAYSRIAPAAPHALHMPSHIFLALGMWDDVIASNEASWKASGRTSYHALQWLQYAYLQQGRIADASRALAEMRQATEKDKSSRSWEHLAWMRAAQIVNVDEGASGALSISIAPGDLPPGPSATDAFATGFGALRNGRLADARAALAKLETLAGDSKEGEKSVAPVLRDELHAAILSSEGRHDEAVKLLTSAAETEQQMPYGFGPPEPVKPSRELLGEILLAAGRRDEAKRAFEAELVRAPKRKLSVDGLRKASLPG